MNQGDGSLPAFRFRRGQATLKARQFLARFFMRSNKNQH
ncbi:hypothetical protein [Polaromonas sp. CG9_12]|nr:hypothetical protein [Polaromonas sp. CG9_12]